MPFLPELTDLPPAEFERQVKMLLESWGQHLTEFSTSHRELLGQHRTYEIDIVVRFEALGASFLVLVECKHHRSPIKRDTVQVLHDRIRETGAHKGLLFSTSSFQSGAIEYAQRHGVALIQIAEGKTSYFTRSFDGPQEPPAWANVPPFVGWLMSFEKDGGQSMSLVSVEHPAELREFIFGGNQN